MRDGTVLRADVYRPDEEGEFPVLLHRTPYGKRNVALLLDIWTANARGYVVIHQDTRGRFASEGDWMPWEHERADGFDSVAWAADLPYSTGDVGMIGGSYTGSTQWSAAIAGAPALRAIAPMVTWRDPLDGLFQRGGALELGLSVPWTLLTGAAHLPRQHEGEDLAAASRTLLSDFDELASRAYWELPSGAMPAIARYAGPDLGSERVLKEPHTVEFSRIAGQDAEVNVPSLNFAGWYDIFLQGSLDNYEAMAAKGVPAQLVVGPWSHESISGVALGKTGDVNFGLTSSPMMVQGHTNTTELQLGWFDRWLKPSDSGELDQLPVKIFVMGKNVWRDESEWPLGRAVETPWYLHPDGHLDQGTPPEGDEGDEYDFDPSDPVITRGGTLVMVPEFPAGPFDQSVAEQRDDVLVYTTEPLDADLEVTGRVRVRLWAATDGPSTDWVVRLCDVDEAGVSRNIADGILRVTTRPGEAAEHDIDLWSTSNVFLAGHRIRVHVTSSNFPRWDRNPNTGEKPEEATTFRVAHQTIFRDAVRPSRIILPVVPS
ncbi:CocE/NonD family hydrolase [Aeromicrobium sp. Root344]|uniref:CocE/NonD family hydrolase n=1 Tax=Aeromicrobium sp. Root344 TaxID=1736521 RepID=UPI001F34ABC0|nr:CocE/NonD family hydrolase [Aeromicrobium sp. Root344]